MNKEHQTFPICVLCQGTEISVSVDHRFPAFVHADVVRIIKRNSGSEMETNNTDKCQVYHARLDYPGCAIEIMKVVCWYNHELEVELGISDPIPCYLPDHMKPQEVK